MSCNHRVNRKFAIGKPLIGFVLGWINKGRKKE